MKVISLFSGAGISDVGFAQAGCEHLAQVEIDKTASSVRRRHFQDTEHFEDIHEFNAIRYRGTCDVVAGGFPCQDYSVAGKREGILGDRGALWWQMLRVIDESMPTYVWGENVPGLLSADNGRSFRAIVLSLVQLGYSVTWRVLDLQNFGIPQRRRRVFIVGTRLASASGGRAGAGIFESGLFDQNGKMEVVQKSVAPCLTAKGAGTIHAGTVLVNDNGRLRTLLPLECERLMGLPDNYTKFGADGNQIKHSARYRMLGNGWSVPQARWLAERFVGETL